MDMRALARRNMDTHSSSAEEKRTLKLTLGNHCARAQANAVIHLGSAGVIGLHTDVCDGPAAFLQMLHNRIFQRKAGEICRNQDLLVFDQFHCYILLFIDHFFQILCCVCLHPAGTPPRPAREHRQSKACAG